MNLPNLLTLARLLASLVFIFLLDRSFVEAIGTPALLLAALVFALASFTDFLDGYLARKWDQVTNFGKLFDPLADKILVGSAFILLAGLGLMPGWLAALLIAREFLVTGLRGLASNAGLVLPADQAGKIKTVLHMGVVLATLLLTQESGEPEPARTTTVEQLVLPGPLWAWWTAWTLALATSWFSGFRYLWACRHLFGQRPQ